MGDRGLFLMRTVGLLFCVWVVSPAVCFAQSYYCSVCGRGFSHPGRAQTHIDKKHDGQGEVRSYAVDDTYIVPTGLRCPRCGKHCENPVHLRNHLAQCSVPAPPPGEGTAGVRGNPQEMPYHCKWCNDLFPTHADATRHAAQCASAPSRGPAPVEAPAVGEARQVGAAMPRPVAGPEDDVIVLKNGEKFVGDVQLMTEDSVMLKTPSGAEVTFTKDQVQEILGIRAMKMLQAVQEGKGPQVAPEKKAD